LSAAPSLKSFYQYDPLRPNFREIIQDKHFPEENRRVLVEVLREQYSEISLAPEVEKNLKLLAQPHTYTLTAGHQLNLFGGPLYTPYKVLTVAKLAQQLSESMEEASVVPVFWIHTEDHDFKEINHYYPSFEHKKTYHAPFSGATGNHLLTEEILGLIPDHFPESLKACFQPGLSLGEATLRFSLQLYGDYGVLVLDARHPRLKALFAEVMKEEILHQSSEKAIQKNSKALEQAGYALQITPRPINLFYMDQEGRDRIVLDKSSYKVVNRTLRFEQDEILALMDAHPERFSPNVSLRPLYQEMILPNLAYSGGWGELSYWMQLKGLFEQQGVNFPLLLPRMSATAFPKALYEQWQALGFEASDIRKPLHQLYKAYMPQIWDHSEFGRLAEEVADSFEKLEDYVSNFSQTLPRSVKGQQVKSRHFLENLYKKIHRVIRHNQPKPFGQIEEIKQQLQPDHTVQERTLGLASFPDFSPQAILELIWDEIEPLEYQHRFWLL
jgi:bacillithiol biosynthesis cysteine-adding enzyme BshC